MTKLHFSYKDVFRSLRIGFSAKKVWMMSLGLVCGMAGYTILTYVAYLASGTDIITVWQNFRLLPFPTPYDYPFPWFSWVIYGVGALFLLCALLVTGAAVSKVSYEQLRGDEFFEAKEAFNFALRNAGSVLASPLLVIAFVALVVAGGLVMSLIGAIPYFGEMAVGLLAVPAFVASLFIVYLLVVLFFCLVLAPSVVGATRSDTFDTLFEVFSCVNEQPGRLVWYSSTAAALGTLGCGALGLAASAAGRVAYGILSVFMGTRFADVMTNASVYFKVSLPDWWPDILVRCFLSYTNRIGLPQIYLPSEYESFGWSGDIAALLIGVCLYLVAIMVASYGFTTWFSGMTLSYAVLAQKKDDKNILEIPEDLEELVEPVVKPSDVVPPPPPGGTAQPTPPPASS